MPPPDRPPPARKTRRPGRRWVPFFAVLGVLALAGVLLPVVYNLNQQLRPEQLAAARELWREQGPRDYDLMYTVMVDRDPQPERNVVLVRDGRAAFAARDGELLRLPPDVGALLGPVARVLAREGEPGEGPVLTVESVFERIAGVLAADPQAGRRNLAVAVFDPRDGHPRRFVHRVSGTSRREEWVLRLYPPGESSRRTPRPAP